MEIAAYVVEHFVSKGSVITLDAGSTNHYIAQEILERDISCTVITNSFNAAGVLAKADNVTLCCAGGVLDRKQNAFFDDAAIESLKHSKSDVYFLSPNGVSLDHAITSSAQSEGAIKRLFIQNAKKVIVVLEHSKFDKEASEELLSFDEVDTIVCDKKTSLEVIKKYEKVVKVTQV